MNGPLKYHGGKHYLAKQIISLMPPHLHYCEPYFGGGAVLFEKQHVDTSECVNDLDGELINFWRVIADVGDFALFKRIIDAVPFSESHWAEARILKGGDVVQRAVAFFIRCRQSLAGRMDVFAPLSRNRVRCGMNEQSSAWISAVNGLERVHGRLKRVVILGPKDAIEVIQKQDCINTLFYLDPPYLDETRTAPDVYNYEMTTAQHVLLLDTVNQVKGKVMLSGYESQIYNDMLVDWNKHTFEVANNAAGGKNKRRMVEVLWCNY